eukprot:9804665-Karenia_brevis.AAC.1
MTVASRQELRRVDYRRQASLSIPEIRLDGGFNGDLMLAALYQHAFSDGGSASSITQSSSCARSSGR